MQQMGSGAKSPPPISIKLTIGRQGPCRALPVQETGTQPAQIVLRSASWMGRRKCRREPPATVHLSTPFGSIPGPDSASTRDGDQRMPGARTRPPCGDGWRPWPVPGTGMRWTTLPTHERGISDGFLHICEGLDLRQFECEISEWE